MAPDSTSNPASGASEAPSILSEVFEFDMVVRETDLDLFGHMNNAVYLQRFEEARWEIIGPRGYGIDTINKFEVGPTILDIRLQFRRELRNRDKVKIKTWVSKTTGKITHMRQVMLKENGEEACIADFVVGLFDMKKRRLVEPTSEWKYALGLPG